MNNPIPMKADNEPFLNALLKGDRTYCSAIIQKELKHNKTFLELYENTLKSSLYKVGELWENNKISVATEHLASAIVEAILNEIYPSLNTQPAQTKSVVLTCAENELHQIGIKWQVMFLNKMAGIHFFSGQTPR